MKTCLIVDDSLVVRKVATRMVENLGFTCTEAEDGLSAYQACQTALPELILLDWNMPNMNGLDFLTKLRAMENGHKPKVIFCTTENNPDFIARALTAGADEYIMKPFDRILMETKLSQVGLL